MLEKENLLQEQVTARKAAEEARAGEHNRIPDCTGLVGLEERKWGLVRFTGERWKGLSKRVP